MKTLGSLSANLPSDNLTSTITSYGLQTHFFLPYELYWEHLT
jgi:hypothetical protein